MTAKMSLSEVLSTYTDPETNYLNGVPVEVLMNLIESSVSEKRSKKSKKSSDEPIGDPKPKRPLNAHFRWMKDGNRQRIKDELMEQGKPHRPTDVIKQGASEWNKMGEDEKKSFEPSEEDMKAYHEAMTEWKEMNPSVRGSKKSGSKKDKLDVEELREKNLGEGWTDMLDGKYLPKYVKGEDGKKISFSDITDAVEAANEIPECGGITAESGRGGWRYTLRMGGEMDAKDSKKSEISWGKVGGGAPAPKKSAKKSGRKSDAKSETKSDAKSEKKEHGLYLSGAGIPDGLDDEVEVEVGSDDEEECEVEEFEHEGKTYVYDEEGNIYDPEGEGEVLGKYVDGAAHFT